LEKVSLFAGTDLRQGTIFGLGIMPYISASIILQLLGTVYPPLVQLKKEGESGRKRVNEYTRYLTVFLCLVQGYFFLRFSLLSDPSGLNATLASDGAIGFGWQMTALAIMTCGTVFLMWLGEQIDEHGIGNGISLIIMAGILAQMPSALYQMIKVMKPQLVGFTAGTFGIETLVVLVILFVGVVFGVVFITLGQRRIPTQNARFLRGRRQFGGAKQYLPLKLNQPGVMPIIFASTILMLPGLLFQWIASLSTRGGSMQTFAGAVEKAFSNGTSFTYNICYVLLIFFFSFMWTGIIFNPREISDQLKESGTFIQGYRPGKRTADYLDKVVNRITFVGAAFLSVVAIIPTVINSWLGVSPLVAGFYGGTGLLIAVSVAFDLIQKIDSHLVMRNYKGLLES
jgi:preprotein translocase subunit SecY